ncbi:MAG TPA: hypothetical protein VKG45_04510 [Actinomycetes bacterium]|nr:hypothetical protein [Actinomycetes bacterium]
MTCCRDALFAAALGGGPDADGSHHAGRLQASWGVRWGSGWQPVGQQRSSQDLDEAG